MKSLANDPRINSGKALTLAGLAAALLLILVAGPLPAAAAEFPGYINYQGKLGNPAGNPLTGTYSLRFRFYTQATGGTLLATDANFTGANAVTVTNGLYSVQIGSLTAGGLSEQVFHGAETWLEIDVSPGADFTGSETLAPRERLASVPFAFRAINAEKLGTGVNIATFTAGGNLALPYSVSAGSFTGTDYSSAPVMMASTVSAPGNLYLYGGGGWLGGVFQNDGTSRIGPTSSAFTTNRGTLDLMNNPDVYDAPGLYLRDTDLQVTAGNKLGKIVWRIEDTSTGGTIEKGQINVNAMADFTSANQYHPVEMNFELGVVGGQYATSYMTINSTATALRTPLLIQDSRTKADALAVVCSTCMLQVVAPAGSGVSVTGNIEASGEVRVKQVTETSSALGAGTNIDWTLGTIHTVTLTANRTLTYSGAVAGQTITLIITQGGAGSFTITWPTTKWPAAAAPTLTTTAGKADIISVFYDGTSYWGFVGGQNY